MKNNYESPTTEVVYLKAQSSFLLGSNDSSADLNVNYEEEEW